jgi:uncharacterized phage protein gp47/JayE
VVVAQAACAYLLDFSVGSIGLALMEACASMATWCQYLFILALQRSRLTTASGTDVDSFVNDLLLTRLPGAAATGLVTFSRISTGAPATIPVGTSVQSSDLTQSFTVTQNTTSSLWSPTAGAYVLGSTTASGSVPVINTVVGTAGNVVAGAISIINSPLPGIDSVTNAAGFTTGMDVETDAALKARFALYIETLPRGTLAAILYAVYSVQPNLTASVEENIDTSGAVNPGFITVVVDDGTGYPSSALLQSVANNVNIYRSAGIRFGVIAPTIVSASINMNITVYNTALVGTTSANIVSALIAYVNSLPPGQTLAYSALYRIIWDADSNLATLSAVTLNSGTADLTATSLQVIKLSGGSAVTVNT